MSISIPNRRRFEIVNQYADLDSPRIIAKGNPTRGQFLMIVEDSVDPLRPRRWEIMVTGGTSYVGDGAKYFVLTGGSKNITTISITQLGYEYDITDVFGNTYHLIFNGARGFNPTIERTAGAALDGPVQIRSILFAFA